MTLPPPSVFMMAQAGVLLALVAAMFAIEGRSGSDGPVIADPPMPAHEATVGPQPPLPTSPPPVPIPPVPQPPMPAPWPDTDAALPAGTVPDPPPPVKAVSAGGCAGGVCPMQFQERVVPTPTRRFFFRRRSL